MKFPITYLAIALLTLTGCEVSTDRKAPAPNNRVLPIDAERNLSSAERAIGVRICEAAQEARFRYESYNDREYIFSFDLFQRGCDEDTYGVAKSREAYFRKTIAGDSLLQAVNGTDLLDDLLTETHPFVNSLCHKLLTGAQARNVEEQNANKFHYLIHQVQGLDTIEITRYSKDREGNYTMRNIEAYRLHTAASTTDLNGYGVVVERVQAVPCADNKTRSTRQILKGYHRI